MQTVCVTLYRSNCYCRSERATLCHGGNVRIKPNPTRKYTTNKRYIQKLVDDVEIGRVEMLAHISSTCCSGRAIQGKKTISGWRPTDDTVCSLVCISGK